MTTKEIFDKAVKDMEEDRLVEAEAGFNFLLDHDPYSPELLFYTSAVLMKRGFNGVVEHLLRAALENNPPKEAKAAIHNNLGFLYKSRLEDKRAIEEFKTAIELYPKDADIYNNIGSVLVNNGTPNEAIYWFDKALKLNPEHASAHWNRSLALLERGSWKEGWKEYEWGFKGDDKRKDKPYGDAPYWSGQKGKTVVVYGEQGIGDEIMFSSILSDMAKDCNLIYDAHPRLANIMRNSFDFPVYGTRKEHDPEWAKHTDIDYRVSIGSLGQYYRNKSSDFPRKPYLKTDPELVEKMSQKLAKLSDKPKIGISWKGGYKVTRKDLRSIALENWGDIFDIDAEFISLQYTKDAEEEIKRAEDKFGIKIHHWPELVEDNNKYECDFIEKAALISALDITITICTSVAHLCGAIGANCIILTPSKPAWRYGIKGNMPWYGDNIKLIRQEANENWEYPLKRAKDEINRSICRISNKGIEKESMQKESNRVCVC